MLPPSRQARGQVKGGDSIGTADAIVARARLRGSDEMKILYHHRTLGDGAEGIHVSSMVEAFRGLGHEVRVASLIGETTNSSTPRTRFLGFLSRCAPRSAYEAMELAYSVIGYRMLVSQIRRWKPDLIYERYTLFNLAGLAAAKRSLIPLVLEVN